MKGRKPEIHAIPGALDKAPPAWLPMCTAAWLLYRISLQFQLENERTSRI
jgi:hypothetical protein